MVVEAACVTERVSAVETLVEALFSLFDDCNLCIWPSTEEGTALGAVSCSHPAEKVQGCDVSTLATLEGIILIDGIHQSSGVSSSVIGLSELVLSGCVSPCFSSTEKTHCRASASETSSYSPVSTPPTFRCRS